MKYILLIAAMALTGCQSLQYAGNSNYQLRQVVDQHGRTGFDIAVKNGKEIAAVKVHLEKDGDKVVIDLEETGVAAFAGQQIAADALKITIQEAAKAAVTAALASIGAGALPTVLPMVGGALSGGGLPAAAIGAAGGALIVHKLDTPAVAPVTP